MPKLQAITPPQPLAKIAYEALRESIQNSQLVPGEIYNEMNLAKELGISKTPVREALLELSAQGLVTFLPRKGVIVNHYTRRDIEEIFELRKAIELAAIEKVAKASPPCDPHRIEKTLKDQKIAFKKKDFLSYMNADRLFHTTISELTGNQRFVTVVENIRDMIHLMGIQALLLEGRGEKVIAEHEKVLEAIKEGDPELARKTLEYHLYQSKKAVLEQQSFEPGSNAP